MSNAYGPSRVELAAEVEQLRAERAEALDLIDETRSEGQRFAAGLCDKIGIPRGSNLFMAIDCLRSERDAARAALRNLQSLLSLPMYRWRDQEDCLTSMIQSPDGEWLLRDDVLDEVNNAIAESVPDTGTASA